MRLRNYLHSRFFVRWRGMVSYLMYGIYRQSSAKTAKTYKLSERKHNQFKEAFLDECIKNRILSSIIFRKFKM